MSANPAESAIPPRGEDSPREDGIAVTPRAPEAALAGRVRRGAVWSGATSLLLRFANIAVMAVVARLLLPHDFGVFAVAVTVHAVVSSIGELGVSSVLMRGDRDPDEVAPTVAAIAITSSVVLGGAMVLLAAPLATALGAADAAGPMRVMAICVVLVGVFAVPSAQLVREFRQDRVFLATVAGFVPGNALLLVLALEGGGAMSFAWSRVVGQLATGIVLTAYAGRRYRPALRLDVAGSVLRFGMPLAGANLVGYALLNADYALIGPMLGPRELGLYMLAFNIASWSTALMSAMINNVAMPAFSRLRHDPPALARAVAGSTRAIALVALPVAALSVALASPLVRTVYGDRWSEAGPVLSILAVYGAIYVLCLLFANLLVGEGHTRLLFFVQVAWLAALLPAMVLGVHVSGIVGAGAAHVLVILVLVLPVYLAAFRKWRVVPLGTLTRPVIAPAAGACLAGLTAAVVSSRFGASPVRLVVGGAAGVVAYGLAMAPILETYLHGRTLRNPVLAGLAGGYGRLAALLGSTRAFGRARAPGVPAPRRAGDPMVVQERG